jgi:hypothetical protein
LPTSDNGEFKDMEYNTKKESNGEEEEFVPPPTWTLQAALLGSFETTFKEQNTRAVRIVVPEQTNAAIAGASFHANQQRSPSGKLVGVHIKETGMKQIDDLMLEER